MKFYGPLLAGEATKCVEAGYRGPWVVIDEDGFMDIAAYCDTTDEDGFGWIPAPGHLLPMSTAPRDGRKVLLRVNPAMSFDKDVCLGVYSEGSALWHTGGGLRADSAFTGWSPIVIPVTE